MDPLDVSSGCGCSGGVCAYIVKRSSVLCNALCHTSGFWTRTGERQVLLGGTGCVRFSFAVRVLRGLPEEIPCDRAEYAGRGGQLLVGFG